MIVWVIFVACLIGLAGLAAEEVYKRYIIRRDQRITHHRLYGLKEGDQR